MTMRKHFLFSQIIGFLTLLLIAGTFSILSRTDASAATKTTLKVSSKSLYVNGTYTIPLKNKKKKATYFYTSNKTKVAKVNSKGKITARGKGTAKIKVRYKLKKKTYTAGTFKVVVSKATLKSSVRTITTTVGTSIPVTSYLDNQNPSATYTISSTNSAVASGASNGTISVKRAGTTTLTIVENYNGKKRTIGKFSISASGASLSTTSLKMAYGTSYNASSIILNKLTGASYNLASTNSSLIGISGMSLIASNSPGYDTTCTINVYETRSGTTRLLGAITVSLIQTAYIAPDDRTLSVGLGAKITIGNNGIKLVNQDPNATYSIVSKNTAVIDNQQIAVNYGTAVVSIVEKKAGSNTSTVLSETVTITVTSSVMKTELVTNGLDLIMDGDTYNDYPVNYRNHMVNYYYTSSDNTICQVGTGGDGEDQDYLVLYPRNAGTVTITVYEISKNYTSQRTIGSFEVRVAKDTAEIMNIDDLMVEDILESCSLYHKGKTFTAKLEKGTRNCIFTDEDGNGILDYGMDYDALTTGNFLILPLRNRFLVDHIEKNEDDPAQWTVYIDLQNETSEHDTDIIPIHIYLQQAPLDASTILQGIQLNLGNSRGTINRLSTFPDNNTLQFADSNTNFVYHFTAKQYLSAGATEFDPDELNPIYISELTNVFCTPVQYVWSTTNADASTTVTSISGATSTNNQDWSFTVTFENGTKQKFTVTLGVTE